MLAKQSWKILLDEFSLLHRVYKAKYFLVLFSSLNLVTIHLMHGVTFERLKNGSIKAASGGLVMERMPKFGKNPGFQIFRKLLPL